MIKNTNVSDMLYIIRKWWRIFLIAYSIQTEIGWASSSLDIAAKNMSIELFQAFNSRF